MNTRKKIINILIFLIIVAALVFGVYWLVSRHQATKTGTPPATFRQFLGFDTPLAPGTGESGGELSSGFTNPDGSSTSSGGTEGGESASSTTGTQTSQFTNDTLSPENTGDSDSSDNGNDTTNGGGTDGSGTGGSGSSTGFTGGPASVTGTAESVCTDADVNIPFNSDELAQLQALQDRFYAIAQTLHTDADAATEEANWSDFVLKQKKIAGLLDYCTDTSKKLSDPAYTTRVPTPFWYEEKDIRPNGNIHDLFDLLHPDESIGTSGGEVPLGYLGKPGQIGGLIGHTITTGSVENALRTIEQVLRLNLW